MLPRLNEIAVDGRVLGLAIVLALVTALFVGMVPAFKLSRTGCRPHALVLEAPAARAVRLAATCACATCCGRSSWRWRRCCSSAPAC